MTIVAASLGVILLLLVLLEAFETVVLPRTLTRPLRLTRLLYRTLWRIWSGVARRIPPGSRREMHLSIFGPLALPVVLIIWAICLIFSFALLQWSQGTPLTAPEPHPGFWTYYYMSGTTFFTLGLGDVTPKTGLSRCVTVLEGGIGFGFLAIVIGYLPVLYQTFSRREVRISLLDSRGGSPPAASEILRRYGESENLSDLKTLLIEWEYWASELLESHLSYPVLAFYRSQHDGESWLAALTAIMDLCSLLMSSVTDCHVPQAKLTFAMARHAIVDLAYVFATPPKPPAQDRLTHETFLEIQDRLSRAGVTLSAGKEAEAKLAEQRKTYEPYVNALADHFLLRLPPWIPKENAQDNWQTSAWADEPEARSDHFG